MDIDKESFFTPIQQERFYTGYDGEEDTLINSNISGFFKELIARKRDDPFEDGMQASIIILPDRFGMKCCENDGKAPHSNTETNIVRHLNGERKYLTVEGTKRPALYNDELGQIIGEGIEVRVLDGEKELMLAIVAHKDLKSEFQIKILRKIFLVCKALKEKGIYETVNVGFHTPTSKIEFSDFDHEHNERLLIALQKEKEAISKGKTK